MLRTAVGSPGDVPTMRQAMQGLLQRLAAQVGGDGPRSPLAFELMGAQMIGVLVLRHLVQIEPMASASTDEMVRHLAPAFRAILEAGRQSAPQPAPPTEPPTGQEQSA
jgi:hypothetical protein